MMMRGMWPTICVGVMVASVSLAGQAPGGRQGGAAQRPTGRAATAFDMTGYWVSVVTEDWRQRMLTPPKGDFLSLPLNAEGRRVALEWDPSQDAGDNQPQEYRCRAFGAPALMRRPGRLHISWQDDLTLKIETSAGNQTRLLHFGPPPQPSERSWQGVSAAQWRRQFLTVGQGRPGGDGTVAGGHLEVVTTQLNPGYLRTNGIPYSENATVTEYFYRHSGPGALEWLTVTTIVDDPRFLARPFITSTDFKKESDGSKFKPTPCFVDPPRVAEDPFRGAGALGP